jgi:hypothetical protein
MKPPPTDLFGEQAVSVPNPGAYAGRPGAGPVGRQCRHCWHYTRIRPGARVYLKCGAVRPRWTADESTDIKASTPACERFLERKS